MDDAPEGAACSSAAGPPGIYAADLPHTVLWIDIIAGVHTWNDPILIENLLGRVQERGRIIKYRVVSQREICVLMGSEKQAQRVVSRLHRCWILQDQVATSCVATFDRYQLAECDRPGTWREPPGVARHRAGQNQTPFNGGKRHSKASRSSGTLRFPEPPSKRRASQFPNAPWARS